MERLTVELGDRRYPILIGSGTMPEIAGHFFHDDVCILTNPVIDRIIGGVVKEAIQRAGGSVHTIIVPDGEQSKDIVHLMEVYDALLDAGATRKTTLAALGGGVIGDLGGFCAATFMRGIPFVQIPTTLLAQVDSSVGGKTAVNHPRGKNLIGAFYQPQAVFIDIDTLDTLPDQEFLSGLAEVIKYGIVLDGEFFTILERQRENILKKEREALLTIVRRSVQIKADIVRRDERESGIRSVLNFGHTLGHAVERLIGYGNIRHGEAVAKGMAFSAEVSRKLGLISGEDRDRVIALLTAYGFDLSLPSLPIGDYREAISVDKKSEGGEINFVLAEGIGSFILKKMSVLDILDFIEQ